MVYPGYCPDEANEVTAVTVVKSKILSEVFDLFYFPI